MGAKVAVVLKVLTPRLWLLILAKSSDGDL